MFAAWEDDRILVNHTGTSCVAISESGFWRLRSCGDTLPGFCVNEIKPLTNDDSNQAKIDDSNQAKIDDSNQAESDFNSYTTFYTFAETVKGRDIDTVNLKETTTEVLTTETHFSGQTTALSTLKPTTTSFAAINNVESDTPTILPLPELESTKVNLLTLDDTSPTTSSPSTLINLKSEEEKHSYKSYCDSVSARCFFQFLFLFFYPSDS